VQRKPHLTSVTFEVASVTLEKLAGSWLLATHARLGAIKGVLIFVIAPLSGSGPPLPPVPAAVKRAGAVLSKQQLEHALVAPRQPMPSFRRLPAAKFKALVEFLSLLR